MQGWARVVSDGGLARFARLLRAYHDAVRTFEPPAGAEWAWTDATLSEGEIVCHGDFGPWNLVWRGDDPVGILDWDVAGWLASGFLEELEARARWTGRHRAVFA